MAGWDQKVVKFPNSLTSCSFFISHGDLTYLPKRAYYLIMITTVSERKLKYLIKESVKEALDTGLMKLRALVVPDISEKEQKDIEKRHGQPSRRFIKSYTLKF